MNDHPDPTGNALERGRGRARARRGWASVGTVSVKPYRPAVDTDTAWLAGLFEGEGSLLRNGKRQNDGWYLSLTMSDEDVVRHAHQVAGVGNVFMCNRARPGWKDMWRLSVNRRNDIHALVLRLLPYLGERRSATAREFLAWWETKPRLSGSGGRCGSRSLTASASGSG